MTRRRKAPMPGPTVIRLMVVEPRTILGVGVRDVLAREDGIEVVAQMRSAEEAIRVVGETAPDVILVKLPSELDAAAEIARRLVVGLVATNCMVPRPSAPARDAERGTHPHGWRGRRREHRRGA